MLNSTVSPMIPLALSVLLVGNALAGEYRPLFDVPHLSGIEIDGDASEWADRGFVVGVLTAPYGATPSGEDANARFRLGWNEKGLLVLVFGRDDDGSEAKHPGMFWTGDAVELFLARYVGAAQRYHVLIGPGLDPDYARLRMFVIDSMQGQTTPGDIPVEAAAITAGTRYVMEILLPWDHIGIQPTVGTEVALQFNLYDRDGEGWDDWTQLSWFPRPDAKHSFSAMHRLRLAEQASTSVRARASMAYDPPGQAVLQVFAVKELAGEPLVVLADDDVVSRGTFTSDGSRSVSTLQWSLPHADYRYPELRMVVDGQEITRLRPPDPIEQRARALMDIELVCAPAVFGTERLPECGPEDPVRLQQLLHGRYEVRTRYYNAQHTAVESAAGPGRYGAVMEVIPTRGTPFRRYRTLFRTTKPISSGDFERQRVRPLSPAFGIDSAVVADHAALIEAHIGPDLLENNQAGDRAAVVLSWLHQRHAWPAKIDFSQDAWQVDRQWWVTMKRRLNGMAQRYPRPFVCPQAIRGEPARVLRSGSREEAGMTPDATSRIDSVCRVWANNTDEGFGVLVARHGVIVVHAAYGARGGRPMRVDDPSVMASCTKLVGGTLFMMLVDQGVIGLDDPVDPFVPAFVPIKRDRPLTPRFLYTMTHGLWGHWGDYQHDFEERLASYYPYLEVARFQRYSGTGLALGGKIIEMVSGEAIPHFYKNHLLDPLGCANTSVTGTGGGMQSTPMDMAKICQMLLNGGAYGHLRFMSSESVRAMYPTSLTWTEENESENRWGIGTNKFDEHGLGSSTFGHDGATVATVRIDPENDLIIVMTRNSTGVNFAEYQPKFMAAVVDGMI